MRLMRIFGGLATVIGVASLVPGPYAAVQQVKDTGARKVGQLELDANLTLQRVCGNCHSNAAAWPWYSQIAPMSWLVRKDVTEGRRLLNFSVWPDYGPEGQRQLLTLSVAQIWSGAMPPARYLLLHAGDKLNDPQKLQLISALERESARLSVLRK